MQRTSDKYTFLIIIILSVFLRLWGLGQYSIWYDEAASILEAEVFLDDPWILLSQPPLYHVFLRLWMQASTDVWWLRLLAALTGLAVLPILIRLGRRLGASGLVASFFLSISPIAIYYAQEIRGYSQFLLLITLSYLCLLRALKNEKPTGWVLYALVNAAAMYTVFTAVFFIAAQGVFVLYYVARKQYRTVGYWCGATAFTGLLYLPWWQRTVTLTSKLFQEGNYWIPGVSLRRIFHLHKNLIAGYSAARWGYYAMLFLFIGLAAWGLLSLCRRKDWESAWFLGTWSAVPSVLMIGVTLFSKNSLMLARVFLPVIPAWFLLMAIGVREIQPRQVAGVVLAAFSVLSLVSLNNQYHNIFPFTQVQQHPGVRPRKDFETAAKYVHLSFREGDYIGHTCTSSRLPFWYYFTYQFNEAFNQNTMDINSSIYRYNYYMYVSDISVLPKVTFRFAEIREIDEILPNYERFWLVVSRWDEEVENFYTHHNHAILDWTRKRYRLLEKATFKGIEVYLFDLGLK